MYLGRVKTNGNAMLYPGGFRKNEPAMLILWEDLNKK